MDAVIMVKVLNSNGLLRASRKGSPEYVRRSKDLRYKNSAYDGTHEWVYIYTKPGGTAG